MSPAPNHDDDTPTFDPRSEHFLESLRNLIEFEVFMQNFDRNAARTVRLFSQDFREATAFAIDEFESDGWLVESVTRIWDGTFFENLPGSDVVRDSTDSDFWDIIEHEGLNEEGLDFPKSD